LYHAKGSQRIIGEKLNKVCKLLSTNSSLERRTSASCMISSRSLAVSAQAHTKREEIGSAHIYHQLAIAEVSRVYRGKDVHESLMALKARVEALPGKAH
jgi:hypothetical protein